MKEQSFFEELDSIQIRHALLFPPAQKQFVELRNSNGVNQLYFGSGYNLPDGITMEIELAFKLVFGDIANLNNNR